MTSRDFVFWLQGFFEISGSKEITAEQAVIIRNHLNMVFRHEIDPSMGSAEHQKDLNDTHNGILVKPTIYGTNEHNFSLHGVSC